jgi:hypothetical protein
LREASSTHSQTICRRGLVGFQLWPERRPSKGERSAARNIHTQESVAIKKVTKIFSKKILAKRALRELK